MSDTNQITVRGRVGTDPKITFLPNNRSVADFRLGSTRRFRDASGEWRNAETEWFTVKAWGPLAESVVTSINRGMPVIVEGVFSTEQWQSGEQLRHSTVITASAVGVDIRHGLVRHVKVRDAAGNGTTAAAAGQAEGDASTTSGASADDAAAVPGQEGGSAEDVDEASAPDTLEDELGAEVDPWDTSVPAS